MQHLILQRQCCVACTQRVVLMSQRRAKESHDPVTQHLVDGSFIAMDGVHHDAQHRIDDLLPLFGIEAFEQAGRTSYVCEKNRDLLSFSFNGMPRGRDLFRQVLGYVRVRGGCSSGWSRSTCRSLIDRLAAIAAETGRPPIGLAAIRARRFEPRATFVAEKRWVAVLSLTFGTNYGHGAARR